MPIAAPKLPDFLDYMIRQRSSVLLLPASVRAEVQRLRQELATDEMRLDVLAELLALCSVGFGDLEHCLRYPRHLHSRQGPDADPRLVVSRLGLALRALRHERSISHEEIVRATHIKRHQLQGFERHAIDPPRPTLEQLDEILGALNTDYTDLGRRAKNPFSVFKKKSAPPPQRPRLAAGGRLLTHLATDRIDLALRSLRAARAMSGSALAAAAGIEQSRLYEIEAPGGGKSPPTRAELDALLEALESDPEQLEEAARYPLRALDQVRERWQREYIERSHVEWEGETIARSVLERADIALKTLRLDRSMTREALANATGIAPARLNDLEDPLSDKVPTEDELRALLGALGGSFEQFVSAALHPVRAIDATLRRRRDDALTIQHKGERLPRPVVLRADLALRALRAARKMSRGQLASASGIQGRRLASLEDPLSENPLRQEELPRLLAALGATLDDFTSAALAPPGRGSAEPPHPLTDPGAGTTHPSSPLVREAAATIAGLARFGTHRTRSPRKRESKS